MYRTLQRRFCPLDKAVFGIWSAFHQLNIPQASYVLCTTTMWDVAIPLSSIGLVCAMYDQNRKRGNSTAIARRISVNVTPNTAACVSNFKTKSNIWILFSLCCHFANFSGGHNFDQQVIHRPLTEETWVWYTWTGPSSMPGRSMWDLW